MATSSKEYEVHGRTFKSGRCVVIILSSAPRPPRKEIVHPLIESVNCTMWVYHGEWLRSTAACLRRGRSEADSFEVHSMGYHLPSPSPSAMLLTPKLGVLWIRSVIS